MFLHLIDDLTTAHLKVLEVYDNPREWYKQRGLQLDEEDGKTFEKTLELLYRRSFGRDPPPIDGMMTILNSFPRELYNRGLTNINVLRLTLSDMTTPFASRTTSLGKKFLEYIREWRPRESQ